MKVTVKFLVSLGLGIDNSEIEVEVTEGATVADLINKLEQKYPSENIKEILLDHQGRLKVALMVNQKAAKLNSVLSDGDKVVFLTVVTGG